MLAAPSEGMQRKTQRPVQFEMTEQTRDAVTAWVNSAGLGAGGYLFPGAAVPASSPLHSPVRQAGGAVDSHDRAGPRRLRNPFDAATKATLIYQRTKNLRAIQLLLGHSKLESTVRHLGIELGDALDIAEKTEV